MKKLLLFAITLFFASSMMAQFNVTFNVDMTDLEGFDPATHTVIVTGSVFGWNEPGTNPDLEMTRVDETLVYTLTYEAAAAGEIQYKYFTDAVAEGWDGGEWTGDPNRKVYVTGETTLNNVWADKPFEVTFMVDLNNALEFSTDTTSIFMAGTVNMANAWNMPGTDSSLMMMPTEADPLIYELTLMLNAGDYFYKYFFVNNASPSWDNGEWTGDPNREVSVDTLNYMIADIWGSAAAINDINAGPITSVFPNPCTSTLNVTFFENSNDINKIEIYNIVGAVVKTIEGFNSQTVTINTSELTSGVYMIAVHNSQGVQTTKFVKE